MTQKTFKAVIVEDILPTRNPEIFQLHLSQEKENEITGPSSVLSVFMKGVSQFTQQRKKVAFTSVGKDFIADNNIEVGKPLPEHLNATIVVREYTEGEVLSIEDKYFIPSEDVFKPYVSSSGNPEAPKKAGAEGNILCKGNSPIYRRSFLSILNMPKEDKLIQYDSVIDVSGEFKEVSSKTVGTVTL